MGVADPDITTGPRAVGCVLGAPRSNSRPRRPSGPAAAWIVLAAKPDPPMPCDRRCSSRNLSVHGIGRVKRSGRSRPTGIGQRDKQQDGTHGQEELARRPEHEVTEPD